MIKYRYAISIGLSLFLSSAFAEGRPEQVQLQRSDHLSLGGLIDDVLEKYPSYEELPARVEEAARFDRKASSFLADSMSLELRYQTGQIGNNDNLREYEAGVEFPVWRPGERRASRAVAREMELEANSFAAFVRWELAGVLRAALWRIELTANRVKQAEKAAQVSADLLHSIERQVDLGTLPRSDGLQAKQDKLNSDIRLNSASTEYANAVRAYRIVTGLDNIPADFVEKKSLKSGVEDDHPALIHSMARLQRATAEHRLQQQSGTSSPALLLGVRSERGGTDPSFEDSVGIFFSYPFGFGAHANAEEAAAGASAAAVRAEHRARRQKMEVTVHHAEQNLTGTQLEYELARQKNELAQQHLAMSATAFELGEMNLMTFLMIKETAYAAEIGESEKKVQWRSAIAQYNQAVGEAP